MSERRVVITGLGIVSCLGNDVKTFWDNLLNGVSGIKPLSKYFDPEKEQLVTRIGGEVAALEGDYYSDKKMLRRLDPFITYGVYAAYHALKQAGIGPKTGFDPLRAGCVLGSGIGGITTLLNNHNVILADGPSRVSPFFVPMQIINMTPGLIAMEYGMNGPNYSTVTACASSNHSIGLGYKHIKDNEADIMIVGGSEATINPLTIAGFNNARALSTKNDEPTKASRPFDKGRDGFVIAEGAGILVLEEYEHAKKRNANILAEVSGYGFTCDANHITAPLEDGAMGARAMSLAIESAKISPDKIDYVNTHGTSTPVGDIAEIKAIKKALGEDHAKKIKVNSTKSMTGHALGAAGGIEAIATVMSIIDSKVHPTINVEEQDPECDLDVVANTAQDKKIEYAISNSFGFGGHNASIVFKRV
ncbi:beta-ketoacyl-ACP synthase II [Brachyspira pilosicoli]|uniref:beta-ketoacyl-ACP synthase II n=1 Tax=Brachyspira pilosicoli TaxID=52584 RepID=UPI001CA4D70B|nr:beta-ketoacyl-ACP synthase II [Brachyspira pilosicoli]MBW5392053.1 beta-ketoacyl-[acyl-carrier-protein] synthase II [Brachyspira pilosicoli]